jgi:hypothetical protein
MEAQLHGLLIQEFHGDGAIGVELGVLGLQLHLQLTRRELVRLEQMSPAPPRVLRPWPHRRGPE